MPDTKILAPSKENIQVAKEHIINGDIVAIPTETVYGLAANAFDEKAIEKIFKAKGRPQDNPLIVHISNEDMLKDVVRDFPQTAQKLARAFWPGPLTMILPKSDKIPSIITAGLDSVGVRMPSHKLALDFINACNVPIAAPSANISGKPSPTKAIHVLNDLDGEFECILDGGECEVGVESTVVKVMDNAVEILRPGKICIDDFLKVVGKVKIDDGVFSTCDDRKIISSPGMKYEHYSPNARVIMVEGSLSDFCKYVTKHADEKTGVLVFEGEQSLFSIPCITYGKKSDSIEQASMLFDALRTIDQENLTTVFARVPNKDGVGLAVYNRLLRACGFEVVNLKKAKIIGLTGQTGTGKTTVCKEFEKKGVAPINCDLIAREVILQQSVIDKLSSYFGKEILNEDGSINRSALAGKVFTDEENLIYLNSVMYPPIVEEINNKIKIFTKRGFEFIILDAPTLFESDASKYCDVIVSVISPLEIRKQRIMERDNITSEQALNRINSQKDDEFYRSKSNYVITNEGDFNTLLEKTADVVNTIVTK